MQKKTATTAQAKPVKAKTNNFPKKDTQSSQKKDVPAVIAKKEPILAKTVQNKQAKPPQKKQEEKKTEENQENREKKQENQEKKQEKPVRETKLQGIQEVIKEIFEKDAKIPLILDESEQFTTFLKYKGSQADFTEFSLLEKLGKKKKGDFIEEIRKQLYVSMKNGHTFAYFFDKSAVNVAQFFEEAAFFVIPQILTPKELVKPEFYKKKVLIPEEDKDSFGNQGYFEIREDFSTVFLYNGVNLEEIKQKINVPLDLFEFVVIKK